MAELGSKRSKVCIVEDILVATQEDLLELILATLNFTFFLY